MVFGRISGLELRSSIARSYATYSPVLSSHVIILNVKLDGDARIPFSKKWILLETLSTNHE